MVADKIRAPAPHEEGAVDNGRSVSLESLWFRGMKGLFVSIEDFDFR